MHRTLEAQPTDYYRRSGLLTMLDRNRKTKERPFRWVEEEDVSRFDVVLCFEEVRVSSGLPRPRAYASAAAAPHVYEPDNSAAQCGRER